MDSKKSSACIGNGDKDHIVLSIERSESTNLSSCRRGEGMIADEEIPEITFTGKKKSVRKKIVSAGLGDESMREREVTEISDNDKFSATRSEEVVESSKSKKKSGRTEYEEDDLDKVLAELGITSVSSATKVEKIQVEPADVGDKKDGEEEVIESASAKKKKKKREKEKKAAASVTDKVEEKKVSKHVQKMQETIARRKEAEERKRKEEEEKLRKEEEERLMQEERERKAEEIRQKRKTREKEKRQQLKQEGKLLTEKQKTEAIKREAFRKMVLNDCGSLLVADKDGASSKRPIYANNKKSAREKAKQSVSFQVEDENDADEQGGSHELDSADVQGVSIIESEHIEVRLRATGDNGDEEEDWDAKSLDSVTHNIKDDFANEEEEPQPMVKKELKEGLTVKPTVKAGVSGKPTTSAIKAMLMVDVATQPKDTSKKSQGLVFHEVSDKNEGNLRSPICCIMGHVDTGKTKLLDCIRGTKVQEGEAGGITQQIGATYFPAENIRERTKKLKGDAKLKVPGLLVIDTPGHESFTNLRSRGSNLCDLAILVVDIMHGLEPQTIESLNLLRRRNAEFIIALNKVDRLYGWKKRENAPIREAMKQQSKDVVSEFDMRLTEVITQFKEQGLNTALYYKNREMGETISIVPTSAISGEGIPDLLLLLVKWAEKTMVEKLTYVDRVQCTVLEVKVIEGHGITIDIVLVNGILHEGDQIVVCGSQGPIVTTIRALLTPHPMKELRVKGTYLHHREIKAAQGIKIAAQGLEHAIAGTALHVIGPDEDVEEAKKTAMEDMESVMSRVDKSGEGVYVQASTLGSLEALLEFLKSPDVKIPVSGIGIGPVHKKDIMKAGVMLEKRKEYAMILAFDVKVTAEARELADTIGVKVVCADIIYHLFDEFKAYMEKIKEEKKKETASEVVFPCVLKILRVFNNRDPIILGVEVADGILKVGTPICFSKRIENSRVFVNIGLVASIKKNGTPVDYAKKDERNVTIKIVASNPGEQKLFGRHFDINDKLFSHISSRSIDVLETNYRDELSDDEWKLVLKLKKLFKIQ